MQKRPECVARKVLARLAFVLGTSAVLAAVAMIAACGRNNEPTGVAGLTSEPYPVQVRAETIVID